MKITVRGHPSKISREKIKDAAWFWTNQLMPFMMDRNLSIRLCISKGYRDKNLAMGAMCCVDRAIRPTVVRIDIDADMSANLTLTTLAHELVHAKQYFTGELRELKPVYRNGIRHPRTKWQGSFVDETRIDYYDLPWEIEAHGREPGLLYNYRQRNARLARAKRRYTK